MTGRLCSPLCLAVVKVPIVKLGTLDRHLGLWLCLTALLVPATGWTSEEVLRWRLITPFPTYSLPVANARRLSADLQAWSAGAIRMEVRAGAKSPPHQQVLSDLRKGQAEVGEILVAAYVNLGLVFGIDTLPFLAVNYPKSRKLWTESRAAIEQALGHQGLRVIQVSPLPGPAFFSTRPLTVLEDFGGLRVWAPDEGMVRLVRHLGAKPVRVPAASLSAALERGEVEALAMSPEAGNSMQLWKWVPYYLDVPVWIPKSAVVVREASWVTVPAAITPALLEVLDRSEGRAWRTAEQASRDAVQALRDAGIAVLRASPAFKQQLLNVGRELTARWTERTGDVGVRIIDRYLSLQL